ncbi:MAG TPA: Clp protease N-terminal domain-containing protein [Candidatus Saccharimonadales bacterium]
MSVRRFTSRTLRVFDLTLSEARQLGRECDGTSLEYVVLALSREHDGIPGKALRSLSIYLEPLRGRVESVLATKNWHMPSHLPHTHRFLVLERVAREEAELLGSNSIDAEHVALAVIRLDEGSRVLPLLGINGHAWRMEILRLMQRRVSI